MLESLSDRDKTMVRYLFDELEEKDRFEFEDRMLLDQELYERMQVVEMNLIDGYVREELSPEERARFVRHFLAFPDNEEKVAAARAFHESLRRVHEREEASAAPAPPSRPPTWGERAASFFRLPPPALALAAFALLAVVVGLIWFISNQRPGDPTDDVANTTPARDEGTNRVVPSPEPSEERPGGTSPDTPPVPDAPGNNNAPAPTHTPTVPKLQRRPTLPQDELAQMTAGNTQEEWVYKVEGKAGTRRSSKVPITIKSGKKTLRLRYQLLEDVLKKDNFKISIENGDRNRVFPEGDRLEDLKPVRDNRTRMWLLVVDVPTSAFKSDGTYYFRIHDPDLRTALVITHAKQ